MKLRLEFVSSHRKGKSKPPNAKFIGEVDLGEGATVGALKEYMKKIRGYAYCRQEWRKQPTTVKDGLEKRGDLVKGKDKEKLSDLGVKDGDVLCFKDLGPQIGYRTVFIWEYLGPMVIFPLFYLYPAAFYSQQRGAPMRTQTLATYYWCGHYAKRILETLLVHRFSHATMPIRNLLKNCSYYWTFAALVSYFVNHPAYTPPLGGDETYLNACLALACLFQAGNFVCHVMLTNLRKPGETGYKIPRGFLFEYITCPNYTCEILGWLMFNLATQTAWGYAFMLAGAYQMCVWAQGKHRRLKKTFGNKYPKNRYVVLPPFL